MLPSLRHPYTPQLGSGQTPELRPAGTAPPLEQQRRCLGWRGRAAMARPDFEWVRSPFWRWWHRSHLHRPWARISLQASVPGGSAPLGCRVITYAAPERQWHVEDGFLVLDIGNCCSKGRLPGPPAARPVPARPPPATAHLPHAPPPHAASPGAGVGRRLCDSRRLFRPGGLERAQPGPHPRQPLAVSGRSGRPWLGC